MSWLSNTLLGDDPSNHTTSIVRSPPTLTGLGQLAYDPYLVAMHQQAGILSSMASGPILRNVILTRLHDNPGTLRAAANYLEGYKCLQS